MSDINQHSRPRGASGSEQEAPTQTWDRAHDIVILDPAEWWSDESAPIRDAVARMLRARNLVGMLHLPGGEAIRWEPDHVVLGGER